MTLSSIFPDTLSSIFPDGARDLLLVRGRELLDTLGLLALNIGDRREETPPRPRSR